MEPERLPLKIIRMVDQGESPRRATPSRHLAIRLLIANALALGGLGFLIRGLWLLSPPVAIAVLGLAMLTAGIIARVRC